MTVAMVLESINNGIIGAIVVLVFFGAVHYFRLIAGCSRSEWECIADAWSALRQRLSHTRRRQAASGRRDQA